MIALSSFALSMPADRLFATAVLSAGRALGVRSGTSGFAQGFHGFAPLTCLRPEAILPVAPSGDESDAHTQPPSFGGPDAQRRPCHAGDCTPGIVSTADADPLRPGPLAEDHVHRLVQVAHSNLDTTRQMLDATPRLIRAAWDWGGGDFETALGGAAHMGRRDIAALLLDRGAPLDLFAAAMLGELAIVRAALETRPGLARVPGPHGIPLIAHAKAGGAARRASIGLLITVLAQLENRK